MKKTIILHVMLLMAIIAFSQPKPKQKDKPPTQKEMADMMKEMQKAMEEMSPEDKKMMDSMGIKMPSTKDLPKVSDKQMAEAWENASRIVPKKDDARIAAIPKTVTDAKMGSYIAEIQNKIGAVLKPVVISTGNTVYDYIKSNSKNSNEAANMALGFYLAGQPELTLYVLGKICTTDAGNTDNLGNYAALLSMLGAQHLAIPILNNLNQKFPKNSTLLNNLGQAWFGLGDIGKAEKYLDSTIRIYAYHPQANLTKSMIEESKGNKQQAIEAAKRSIKHTYSIEKANRLNKLGYTLKPKDLSWNRPMPKDALGLDKFKWPDYPMNVDESQLLEPEWEAFIQTCNDKIHELEPLMKTLEQNAEQANEMRTKQLMQARQRGIMISPFPNYAHIGMVKLGYLVTDKDGHIAFNQQKKWNAVFNAQTKEEESSAILENQHKVLDEKYKDLFGEGKSNPFEAACADYNKAFTQYLSSSNTPLRDANNDLLSFMRRKINDELYYYQYTMWPENFEMAKVQAKIGWLNLIKQAPKFHDKSSWCAQTDVGEKHFTLADFDDIACQYESSLNLGCVKMETKCSQVTTTYGGCGTMITFIEKELGQNYVGGTLKLSPKKGGSIHEGPLSVDASIGLDATIELDENNRVKEWEGKITGTVEAGVGITKGPVKAGASVSESLEVELGSEGIGDVVLITSAKIEAGVTAPGSDGKQVIDKQINQGVDYVNKGLGKLDSKVEIGVESRTSLVSGHSTSTVTGSLGGVKISGF